MAIATAVQRGQQVYVYNEKGSLLAMISTGGPDGKLHGFTSSTISIQRGRQVYVYNEHGNLQTSLAV